MRRLVTLALVSVFGCGYDHTPHVRPTPRTDDVLALRKPGKPLSSRIANYRIDARLDTDKHQIAGTETLTWTNTGTTPVDRLPFHLYLNAFKNDQSLFWQSSGGAMRMAHASDWGWIQVDSVQLAGSAEQLVGKLEKKNLPDETVVELPVPQVEPGASISVTMAFHAQLPEVWARTGYKGEFHMIGQWFPKIGVRVGAPGEERWECRAFHANSEFFADFGTYDVTLTVPNTYVVGATGVLRSVTDGTNGTRTYTYRAEDVHDFAWMADPYMETIVGRATVDNDTVEVRVMARPEQRDYALRHLDAAVGAIEKFSAAYGPYPWPIMTVIDPPVDAMFGAGGMEYPTLVTTAGDTVFARPGIRLPEYVTVHEVGHNWFQGMLASNEVLEAWLDEGVNEWADGKVMNELYGPLTSGLDWLGWTAEMDALRTALAEDPASLPSPIASATYAFVDNEAYGSATYMSTMRALRTLEQTVGATKFAAAMKAYAGQFAFQHPTGRDLFDTLTRELGQDLTWYFGPVWHDVGGMELGIRSVTCRPAHEPRGVFADGLKAGADTGTFVCEIVITNTGRLHVPIDVEVKFADGSVTTPGELRWDDHGTDRNWHAFTLRRSSRIAEVTLDPEGKISLDSPVLHRWRVDGDGSAALRAGAWFGATAQTLMQIVGP